MQDDSIEGIEFERGKKHLFVDMYSYSMSECKSELQDFNAACGCLKEKVVCCIHSMRKIQIRP